MLEFTNFRYCFFNFQITSKRQRQKFLLEFFNFNRIAKVWFGIRSKRHLKESFFVLQIYLFTQSAWQIVKHSKHLNNALVAVVQRISRLGLPSFQSLTSANASNFSSSEFQVSDIHHRKDNPKYLGKHSKTYGGTFAAMFLARKLFQLLPAEPLLSFLLIFVIFHRMASDSKPQNPFLIWKFRA